MTCLVTFGSFYIDTTYKIG